MRVLMNTNSARHSVAGFTLLEVMISMLVLSIGLLGLAGLQATGIRNNHSAYMHSQALSYGYDIIDRMRANRLNALSGNYNLAIGVDAPSGTSIAETDLREWKNLVTANLTAGDASANVNGGVVTVVVQWDDRRAEKTDGESIKNITVQTEL